MCKHRLSHEMKQLFASCRDVPLRTNVAIDVWNVIMLKGKVACHLMSATSKTKRENKRLYQLCVFVFCVFKIT